MRTFRFTVHGMNGDCVADMRRVIFELDGVDKVEVALRLGMATVQAGIVIVHADPEQVTPARIVTAINGLGHYAELCAHEFVASAAPWVRARAGSNPAPPPAAPAFQMNSPASSRSRDSAMPTRTSR